MNTSPTIRSPRRAHIATIALVATAVLSAFIVLGAPPATAQDTDPPPFGIDNQLPFGTACPDGSRLIGDIDNSLSFNGTWCRPDGYEPIRTFDVCETAGAPFWSSASSVCAFGAFFAAAPPTSCPPPSILIQGLETITGTVLETRAGCALPILQFVGFSGRVSAGAPVCIESDLVQTDPNSADGQVGTQFIGADGVEYLVHYGPPTCQFNCVDGFDINCDGVLGDYCPVEVDRFSVAGVGECLAALNPSVSPIAEPLPAAGVAPVAVAPVPVAGPALAHSGSETSVLAYLGAGLLGFGALALGSRRKL